MTAASVNVCEISDIKNIKDIKCKPDVVAVRSTTDIIIKPERVINVVGHLTEIDKILKTGTKDGGKAVESIPMIVDCIQTLGSQQFHFHEELEKETINRFVLQHSLCNLPQNIENEVNAAVEAAKRQNEETTKCTTEEVADLEEKISKLEEEQSRLEKENNILVSQRNKMKQKHENCLLDLNKLLAQKSKLHISLNETRENIKLKNQEIVQTEIDILELKKVVAKEWEEANKKIAEYKIDIETSEKHLKTLLTRNELIKKEEDKIKEKLAASNLIYQEVEANERYLKEEVVLKKKGNHKLKLEMAAEVKQQKELKSERKKLSQQYLKLTKESETTISGKKKILNELTMRYEYTKSHSAQVKQQIQDQQEGKHAYQVINYKFNEIKVSKETERKSKEKLEDIRKIFERHQADHKRQTKGLHKLEITNSKITESIQNAKTNSNLITAHLNQEIQKYNEKLDEEKNLREDIQQEHKDLCTEIDVTKVRHREYVGEMKKKIENLRKQHIEMTKGTESLQNDVEELDSKILALEEEEESDKVKFAAEIEEKKLKIKEIQQIIAELEKIVKEKKAIIEEKTPPYEELKKKHQQVTEDFNEISRRTDIALTNEQKDLEKSLQETKAPLSDLRKKIKESNEEYFRLLDTNTQKSKTTEEEIYVESSKLKVLIEENNKLKQNTKSKETESENIKISSEKLDQLYTQLKKDLSDAKDQLTKDLKTIVDMQEIIEKRDQISSEQMDISQNIVDKNIKIVNDVTNGVYKELETFGIFLHEAETRRPE